MSIVSLDVCSLANRGKVSKINQNFVIDAIKHYFVSHLLNFSYVEENFLGTFACMLLKSTLCARFQIWPSIWCSISSVDRGKGRAFI